MTIKYDMMDMTNRYDRWISWIDMKIGFDRWMDMIDKYDR